MIEKYYTDKISRLDKNVACIGYFDGVHKGHQELIKKTVELGNAKHIKKYAITFNPDPLEVIVKKRFEHITTFNKKVELFERYGLDGVVVIPFTEYVMTMTTETFKKEILDKLNIDTLVCGKDWTYAYKGKGNPETLKKQGINVCTIDPVKYYGKRVSSTRIKKTLDKGRIKTAEKMLGHEYK